ncbi:MAG: DUF309 domain-containing protein [Phycisphaeraceae bacterium]
MSKSTFDTAEEAQLFHKGIELFNDGEWFEAHEVWEDIWRMASGNKKRFYQGLIQCAVTIEHIHRGNPRGAVTVFESATSKFVNLPDLYMGINAKYVVSEIGKMIAAIRALPKEMFDPRKGRGLDLPVDLNDAPKIKLEYDPFADETN